MWTLLKLLRSEAGYISAAIAAAGLISNIAGNAKKNKGGGGFKKTGEEKSLQDYTQNWLNQYRGQAAAPRFEQYPYIQQGLEAAKRGGLFGAIQDAFNPNPTTTELQGVTGQTRQLRNQILNSGAKGGLLRSQLADVSKAGAANRLALMENARQQAAQRGFQAFLPMEPTQATDIARLGQLFNYDQLANQNWSNLARLGVERNLGAAKASGENQSAKGGGIGSLMGQGIGGIGAKGNSKGPISGAVGGTPTFSMPGVGEGFPAIPFGGGGSPK